MIIVNTEGLPDFEYYKVGYPKKQIVLHHTVSAVGKYVDDWFKADKGKSKVAVAYVVDKDGTVFKLFEPEYWAYHIGKGSNKEHNKYSIGIEIVNEGPLHRNVNGIMKWWIDNKYKQGRYEYKHTSFDLGTTWRDYRYFASYTNEQYQSVNELLTILFKQFNIRRNFTNSFDYSPSFLDYLGVVMHVNLRQDKTDLSPAYDIRIIDSFVNGLKANDIIPIKPYESVNISEFDIKKIEMATVDYDLRSGY